MGRLDGEVEWSLAWDRRDYSLKPAEVQPSAGGLVDHRVLEHAEAGDLDAHDVAGLHELLRIARHPDTRRRAREDDVAGLERERGRQVLDERRHAEDQLARVRAL